MGRLLKPLTVLAVVASTGAVKATLVDRGGGMIYDPDQNITWLADANFARTSGYDDDGLMPLAESQAWVNSLIYGGFSGWRLPSAPIIDPTCTVNFPSHSYGYNCRGNELGHLFDTHFDGVAGQPAWLAGSPHYSLFTNISQSTYLLYWFGSPWYEDASQPGFLFYDGSFNYGGKDNPNFAWAVHDGDIGAAIPEPATFTLVLSLLLGMVLMNRADQRTA